jgi:hypothetical protein
MDSLSINQISVNEFKPLRKVTRLGLDTGLTGVPAFLIYLREELSTDIFHVNSHENIRALINDSKNPEDKKTWEYLLPFFETGGTMALIVSSPLTGKNEGDILADMIGHDQSYKSKTGIYKLRSVTDYADLVLAPQASQLLSGDQHLTFYKSLFSFVETLDAFFVFSDLPRTSTIQEQVEWSKKVNCAESGLFYPWLVCDGKLTPPGPVVAGIYQNNDKINNISDNPSNRAQVFGWNPIIVNTPNELNYLNENRVNCIQFFSSKDIRIWGAFTLSSELEAGKKFIAIRRALKSTKRALDHICEQYVLEPLINDVSNEIEMTIESFFEDNLEILDPMVKHPFSVDVDINKEDVEDYIQVDVSFKLPNSLDEIKMALEYQSI